MRSTAAAMQSTHLFTFLSNPDIQMVLTGARSVEELELNVAAAERGPLPQEILDAIGNIYAMCPQRPYLEPLGLSFKPDYSRNDDK